MTPDCYQQIDKVFQAAIERDPAERPAFLDQACASDPSLRSEVEALIDSSEKAGSFIEVPVFEAAAELVANADTDPGTVLGTVNYMSPEQARGLALDSRTDLFSLGVVLYEMITARPPFEGKTAGELIALIISKEPPPLARYSQEAPEALQWIVTKALTKDREARYQTAKDMMVDLRRLKQKLEFEDEQARSIRSSLDEPMVAVATGTQPVIDTGDQVATRTGDAVALTTSSAEIILSEIKRHKKGAALIVVGLAIVIAGLAFGISKLISQKQTAQLSSQPFATMKLTRLTTSDGQWVVYSGTETGLNTLWKIPIGGGSPIQLTDYASSLAAPSPDGKQIAFRFVDEQATPKRQRYAIITAEGGQRTKVLDLPDPLEQMVRWTPDGRALTYVGTRDGVSNAWAYPLDGGPPKQLTGFKSDRVFGYAWSRDGKQIAVARGSIATDVVLINAFR